jgi:hypothetical protein
VYKRDKEIVITENDIAQVKRVMRTVGYGLFAIMLIQSFRRVTYE